MSGMTDLDEILSSLSPELKPGRFVFCTVPSSFEAFASISPVAMFMEQEGLTLVLRREYATNAGLDYQGEFSQITLSVHSSLESVGLTAAVSSALAAEEISANVIAAYYHDHVFVPVDKTKEALEVLQGLSGK